MTTMNPQREFDLPAERAAADASVPHSAAMPSEASSPAGGADGSSDALVRIERLLAEIRGHLEASARDARFVDFSPLRLAAAVLQVLVIGLLALGLLDWVAGASPAWLLVKLGFATVLQLATLTAWIVSRRGA